MTPEEHYRAAEDALESAYLDRRGKGAPMVRVHPRLDLIAAAQVHALLALAGPQPAKLEDEGNGGRP